MDNKRELDQIQKVIDETRHHWEQEMVEIRKLGTEKYLAPVRSYQNADDVKPNAFNVPRVRFHGGDQEDHDATDVCAEAEDSDDPDVLLKRYDSLKKNKVFGP